MWGDAGGEDFDSLVTQIKELQRNDPAAKEQWISYVEQNGESKRDPSRHDPTFLQTFLTSLNQGTSFVTPEANITLAEAVKLMQKRSQSFKQVWAGFCAKEGGGKNDPMKHDTAFCAKFFDQLATKGGHGGAGPIAGPTMGCGDNPLKRMRMASGMGMGSGGAGGALAAMVDRVKGFQRLGMEQKELWGSYADTYLGGVRDPSRHDAETLREFCDNHNVPAGGTGGGGGGGGMGGSFAPKMGGCMSMGGSMSMGDADPEKAALVDQIKGFQRQSPENKEVWGHFIGTTRDPNKHDKEKLQEFLSTVRM